MSGTIYLQAVRALGDMVQRMGQEPKRITFNRIGFIRALGERDHAGMSLPVPQLRRPGTYLSLPYGVVDEQIEQVKVWSEQDLMPAISFRVPQASFTEEPNAKTDTDIVVIAKNLSAPQLCEIIAQWTAKQPANDALAMALNDAVRRYGRFE